MNHKFKVVVTNIFQQKKLEWRWLKCFALINYILFFLCALRYFINMPVNYSSYSKVFLSVGFIGHFGLLSILLIFLLPMFTLFVFPKRWALSLIAVICSSFSLLLLFVDTIVFSLYKYHMNFAFLRIIFSSDGAGFFDLSATEWLLIKLLVISIFCVEGLVAWGLWKWINKGKTRIVVWPLLLIIVGGEVAGQGMHAWAVANNLRQVVQLSQVFPAYMGLTANHFLVRYNFITPEELKDKQQVFVKNTRTTLNYPLHPLREKAQQKAYPNILIVSIDAWRADTFTKKNVPNIYNYSKSAWVFAHHYSGGNCTKSGLFSLFYGLPSDYWDSMDSHPVLFDILKEHNYKIRAYVSSGLMQPPFYKNVFKSIPNLLMNIPGDSAWEHDEFITKKSLQVIKQAKQDGKPFFMFLHYDAAHAYDFPPDSLTPFVPWMKKLNRIGLNNQSDPIPLFNRYKNALFYADGLISKLLKDVDKNTIVIITSDHGEEFNDNHLNYWGHSSNFTAYQLHIPLIVHWPGKTPAYFNYRTSHYDIVPTLLQDVFHVQNPIADYSVGNNLAVDKSWENLEVGSYFYNGLITPKGLFYFYPGGIVSSYNFKGKSSNFALNSKELKWHLEQVTRFRKFFNS